MITYCGNCTGMWESSERADEAHFNDSDHGLLRSCTPDDVGHCSEGVYIDVWLHVFDTSQQVYGGPQEGGWNKTVYEPVANVKLRGKIVRNLVETGDTENGPSLEDLGYTIELEPEDRLIATQLVKRYERMFTVRRHGREYVECTDSIGFTPVYETRCYPPYYS